VISLTDNDFVKEPNFSRNTISATTNEVKVRYPLRTGTIAITPYYLYSTGHNSYGTLGLGDNTKRDRFTLVDVEETTITQMSGGNGYMMILKSDGTLWNTFIQVGTDTNWASVNCGPGYQTFAFKTDGTLWGTGANSWGQLGLGSWVHRTVFTPIPGDWASVYGGELYTMALKSDGTLWGTGMNGEGALGVGDWTKKNVFTQEKTLATDWTHVSSGSPAHTFAFKTDGTVHGTGFNNCGQLGFQNTTYWLNEFTEIPGSTGFTFITCGYYHSMALKSDGTIWGCGENYSGECGVDHDDEVWGFTQESTLATDWESLDSGDSHTVAKKRNGNLWSTGDGYHGALGLGDYNNRYRFNLILSESGVPWTMYECTGYSTFGIGSPAPIPIPPPELVFGGNNYGGPFGNGDWHGTVDEYTSHAPPLRDIKKIEGGYDVCAILKEDGTIWSAGDNSYGYCGLGYFTQTYSSSNGYSITEFTQECLGHTDWVDIWSGQSFVLALKADGTLWGVGHNGEYNLGIGEPSWPWHRHTYTQIGTDTDWVSAGAAWSHSFGIKENGTLWAWGDMSAGQLGLGYMTPSRASISTPIQVGTDTDWAMATGGDTPSIALKQDGTLLSCGPNDYGECGVGYFENPYQPDQYGCIYTFTEAVESDGNGGTQPCGPVFANATHFWHSTMAVKKDGTLWAVGQNYDHQLGIGHNDWTNICVFTQVGTDTDWDRAEACDGIFIIRKTDGSLWGTGCDWGGMFGFDTSEYEYGELRTPQRCGAIGSDDTFLSVFSCVAHGILAMRINK